MLTRCLTLQSQASKSRIRRITLKSRNMASRAVDPTSLSNPHECKVKNLIWNIATDFDRKVLHGSVDLHAESQKDGVKELVVDTKTLNIKRVVDAADPSKVLPFTVAPAHDIFGSALHITVGGDAGLKLGDNIAVRVEYETSPNALAIQWLSASQTAGKKHPYLFTQCQAIHARTMLPCQDTPSVKAPYEAHVTVNHDLVALMSAVPTGSSDAADGKHKVFSFRQALPIPSYLIALAVGALVSRDIGPRSKVWSEAEMVDAGAFEFAETENFISIAERLVGPYVWGRYDVLLLPPAFPYGGMENPCLTFVTPTLLAGDRSNADVVAHEISHSWTGNLVSNLTWEHFWLNEGFTMFLERKILAAIHGEKYFDFDSILGIKHLQDDIEHFGATNPLTNMMPKLENIDPDDAFSSVPYEKGFTFLVYLERLVGGPKMFEPFFRAWIEAHHYKCVTSFDFKNFFNNYFAGKVDEAVLKQVDWDAWFNTPGMPIIQPEYDTSLADASNKLAARWIAGGADVSSSDDTDGWTAKQFLQFLDKLLDAEPLPISILEKMDSLYKFNNSKNAEIRFRWYQLGLKVNWEAVLAPTLEFVTSQGRMKFTRPLYRALFKSTIGKEKAVETFQKHRDFYHAICAKLVAKDLHLA